MRYLIGERLRAVRERRRLTLKGVAEAAGVSESLVSQIERNRVSPALDTLLSIADALDVDFDYLFADLRKERAVRIVHPEDRRVTTRPGAVYERLAEVGGEGRPGIEAYLIVLAPGARTGYGEYGHPGFELGFVYEGKAELELGAKVHPLEAGDSVSFQADVPHVVRNVGAGPLRMLWVVTPPRGEVQ